MGFPNSLLYDTTNSLLYDTKTEAWQCSAFNLPSPWNIIFIWWACLKPTTGLWDSPILFHMTQWPKHGNAVLSTFHHHGTYIMLLGSVQPQNPWLPLPQEFKDFVNCRDANLLSHNNSWHVKDDDMHFLISSPSQPIFLWYRHALPIVHI